MMITKYEIRQYYANEERVKQDFSTCQWFYWSDWFDGYDTLVKMIAFCDSVNE